MGRLFSTVEYGRKIIFSEKEAALRAIDSIAAIHSAVEKKRGAKIPEWAYRDVLFLLIDYSIRSYEVLERELILAEKEEVFDVFNRLGTRMGIKGLPENYRAYEIMREEHLEQDLEYSKLTKDLYKQYRKHLGPMRFQILKEAQTLVSPPRVRELLNFRKVSLLSPVIVVYKLSRFIKLNYIMRDIFLPSEYKKEIRELDSIQINKCPYSNV
ncbi:DUF2236 domain-containing protein [Antarcticibacterium sp. 1MA-6-2]|uniref:oxygenase MpaB family protein n=1 Tax=Antarcticibacterium sp. 1MA-6-2 TaxID=2908210 RepID=UPI001F24AA4F|nr:oxygenase MpaB family protein [Antarcticibacterium sp. 1MA-6-2]UJH92136.1 DUF2236 domain-containing protein [Antarcticibacterium sp. 1MA-6-2]